MASTMPVLYPAWLDKALHSNQHIRSAITELQLREQRRDVIRDNVRRGLYPDLYGSKKSSRKRSLLGIIPGVSSSSQADIDPKERELEEFYSIAVGARPDNLHSNRYSCIEPYDRTRVVVPFPESHSYVLTKSNERSTSSKLPLRQSSKPEAAYEQKGRYLNASWVRELQGGKWWIATQAPLPKTTHEFLSLLLRLDIQPPTIITSSAAGEQPDLAAMKASRIRTIVQLTLSHESGRVKAHPYFPTDINTSHVIPASADAEGSHHLPPLKITLIAQDQIPEAGCIVSTLRLTEDKNLSTLSTRKVNSPEYTFRHLLYQNWPDHGVPSPSDRASLLKIIRLTNELNRDTSVLSPEERANADEDPPMIVGCSAGIGRTGAFIALNSLLRANSLLSSPSASASSNYVALQNVMPAAAVQLFESPLGPLQEDIRDDLIAQEIDLLRDQRPGMVQKPDQVLLVYEMLGQAFRERYSR